MARPIGRDIATRAQRATDSAILGLSNNGLPWTDSKAIALAELVNALERIQARLKRPWKTGRRGSPAGRKAEAAAREKLKAQILDQALGGPSPDHSAQENQG